MRNIFPLSVLIFAIGCSANNTVTDLETITKDDAFRQSITTGNFIKLSAGHTYYEFSNPKADIVLVLVHGFSVPSFIWDSTYRAASQRGYATLRYDNFGRGYSDNPDVVYDVSLFSQQLHELLDSLQITKPITLVGLSDGGRTITDFAANFPTRIQNLVYVDAVGFESANNPAPPVIVTETEVAEFKTDAGYSNMAKGQLTDFYDSIPFRGWDKKYEQLMRYRGFVRALLSTRKNRSNLKLQHQKITEAKLPVFAIWGEHDNVVVLNEVRNSMLTRLPSIKLFVIPNAGHLPHMEQTKLFNQILLDEISAKKFTRTAF
jgi:pimeloyl-ACP methyl ester carboxylesterase